MKQTLFIALALSATISSHIFAQTTSLHEAARNGDVKQLTQLIAAGTDVDIQDEIGCTALHYAAFYGHTDCVSALIKAEANANIKDNDNKTALDLAKQEKNCSECIELLDPHKKLRVLILYGLSVIAIVGAGSLLMREKLLRTAKAEASECGCGTSVNGHVIELKNWGWGGYTVTCQNN